MGNTNHLSLQNNWSQFLEIKLLFFKRRQFVFFAAMFVLTESTQLEDATKKTQSLDTTIYLYKISGCRTCDCRHSFDFIRCHFWSQCNTGLAYRTNWSCTPSPASARAACANYDKHCTNSWRVTSSIHFKWQVSSVQLVLCAIFHEF